MAMDFNLESGKPAFQYRRNPLAPSVFQIFMLKEEKGSYEPVGEYTLLDLSEDLDITEKKVINLVSLLNGRRKLVELGNLTKARLLFTMVPKRSEGDPTKIIFRSYNGSGPSVENAVLTLEKGVLDDSQTRETDS
ncbi:MAG: hypothetical protein IT559_03605 [Alphaproteobacteria bacterium]|nr:hypothetical protein [Alphaproteobacteria bacterium]